MSIFNLTNVFSQFVVHFDNFRVTHDDSEENTHRTRRDTTFVSSKEKPSYLIKRKGFYDRHDSGYYPKCNRCYNTRNEALPLLSLGLLAFFLFYFVVVLASTTSTTSTTAAPVAVVPAKKVTNKLFTPIDGQYDNHFAQDGRPFVFHFHFLPVPQGTTGYNSLQPTTGSPINKIKETSQTYSTARPTTTTEYVTTRITTTKSVITEAPIQTAPPRTTTVKRPFYQSTKAHNTKIQIRANASVHGQLPNHSPAVVFQMPNIMPMYHPQMVPFESLFKPLSTTKPQMEPITYRNPNPFLSNAFAGNDGMKLGLNSNNTMTLVLNRPFHQLPYHNPIFQHIINSQLKATPTPAIPTTTTKASNDRPPKIPIHIVIKELHKNSPVNTKNKATPPSKPSYPEQVTKLTNLASDGSYYDYITDLIKRVGRSMVSKKCYGKFMHEKPRSINRPEGNFDFQFTNSCLK